MDLSLSAELIKKMPPSLLSVLAVLTVLWVALRCYKLATEVGLLPPLRLDKSSLLRVMSTEQMGNQARARLREAALRYEFVGLRYDEPHDISVLPNGKRVRVRVYATRQDVGGGSVVVVVRRGEHVLFEGRVGIGSGREIPGLPYGLRLTQVAHQFCTVILERTDKDLLDKAVGRGLLRALGGLAWLEETARFRPEA